MTEKIFWKDPYQRHLETEVTSVADEVIGLKETIFYAFSGGQESDSGSIGGFSVLEARKISGEIVYTLPKGHGLSIGDSVAVEIDWDRRYKLMRLHFAAEVVLELVYKQLVGSTKIGAHISAEKARIDFQWAENISGILPEIKKAAQSIIDDNSPIISEFSDEANERRFWQVENFSRVPCGGTHLRYTGEVGEIKLKRKNIGKGKERIEISLA